MCAVEADIVANGLDFIRDFQRIHRLACKLDEKGNVRHTA
jgi:hypothetical protein